MLKTLNVLFALAVSLVVAGNLMAADKEKKPRPDGRHAQFSQFPMIERLANVKGLNLTDDQKTKLEALKKEYQPKNKEARAKLDSIVTDEQKKARDEAMKAAKAAGKKGREVFEAGRAAMKFTDEQKTKMQEAFKAMGELRKEINGKVMNVLTPEQKDLLKKMRPPRKERKLEIN